MPRKSALINVVISNFVDVTASQSFSTASLTLDTSGGAPPGVSQPAGPNTRIDVSDVSKLVFKFQPEYKPVDVMFAQTAGTTDEDGRINLTSRIKRRRGGGSGVPAFWVLIVIDTLTDGGPVGTANFCKWKFFIAVQRLADGKIGIIDPEVSNTDQD